MSECTHDCGSCGENCAERQTPQDFLKKGNALSKVRKVIAVVSGKGGVGKTLVTALLAAAAARAGKQVGVLDADITGPSVPRTFGLKEKATGNDNMIFPVRTKTGIRAMSLNLLLDEETKPVVWRGPIIAGMVEQFWTDVVWGELDCLYVDLPPGTGDVPLTVFQSLPVDGIIVVTSPQELVSMIVEKAVNMAKMMGIPVLGLVENMSYYTCPKCGEPLEILGKSRVDEVAARYGIDVTARLPIDPALAAHVDAGDIESYRTDALAPITRTIDAAKIRIKNK